MAASNEDATEVLTSVETDAAPSVDYVTLGPLDIGSECEVKTDLKPGSKKVDYRKPVAIEETNETVQPNDAAETAPAEEKIESNLETGLGSLNLEENVKPEVLAADDDLKDCLLQQDSDGDTLLHVAILLINLGVSADHIIDFMVDLKISLDIPNHLNQTPLHLAVLDGLNDVVRALLTAGAAHFHRDHLLRTPMSIACEKNDLLALGILLEYKNFNITDHDVRSKLLNPEINSLDLPNADGERCLHLAVRHNNIEMARILVESGADPNLPDRRSGRTPLHVAADLGHVEMVRYLISVKEMDFNQRTYNDETALDIAHMRERVEVVTLLKPISFPVMKRKSKTGSPVG